MKHLAYIILHSIVVFLFGLIVSIPVNHWYTHNYVHGEEDVGAQLTVSIFFLWPLLLAIGGWVGHRRFKKKLASKKH